MESKFLTVNQAAKYLDLSVAKIYILTRLKEIEHFKPAGRIYFTVEGLNRFVEQSPVNIAK